MGGGGVRIGRKAWELFTNTVFLTSERDSVTRVSASPETTASGIHNSHDTLLSNVQICWG
jgi:hypothetical protein